MKNNCMKCGEELGMYSVGLCYGCQKKADKFEIKVMVGITIVFLVVVIGIRLLWAKIAYNDLRCAVGECRIIKSGNE